MGAEKEEEEASMAVKTPTKYNLPFFQKQFNLPIAQVQLYACVARVQ